MGGIAQEGRWAGVVAVVVLAMAILAVSVPQRHRSYWLDEAWVVDYALENSLPGTLSATVAHGQPAAAGYMALLHLVGRAGLAWPPVFRVPSAVFTLLALVVLCRYVAWIWDSTAAGLFVALGVMACTILQRYDSEIKQYSIDVLATVLMIGTARMCRDKGGDTRSVTAWGMAALFGSLLSFAGVFAVAGSGLVLLVYFLARGNRPGAARVTGASLLALIVFAIHYFFYIRPISRSPGLNGYWVNYFLEPGPSLPRELWALLVAMLRSAWRNHPGVRPAWLLGAAALGWLAWLGRDRVGALCALVTLVLTVAACAARKWPMVDRLSLHVIAIINISALILIPVVVLNGAELVGRATGWGASPRSWLGVGARACLWVLAGGVAAVLLKDSVGSDVEVTAVGPLLEETARRARAGDTVLLDYTARVNQRVSPRPMRARVVATDPALWVHSPDSILDIINRLSPSVRGRLYILVSHSHEGIKDKIRRRMTTAGIWGDRFRLAWKGKNVGLYTYDPTGPRAPPIGD